ncbi:hypothetical protein GCM10009801_27400 [Streptomyces albiaxialis]|uniref:Uncharacterized protein n=1 Tax=Streptomyces albiaxialis TaxID=329523 RepID=A0ABN2VVB5_9ACTN
MAAPQHRALNQIIDGLHALFVIAAGAAGAIVAPSMLGGSVSSTRMAIWAGLTALLAALLADSVGAALVGRLRLRLRLTDPTCEAVLADPVDIAVAITTLAEHYEHIAATPPPRSAGSAPCRSHRSPAISGRIPARFPAVLAKDGEEESAQ